MSQVRKGQESLKNITGKIYSRDKTELYQMEFKGALESKSFCNKQARLIKI